MQNPEGAANEPMRGCSRSFLALSAPERRKTHRIFTWLRKSTYLVYTLNILSILSTRMYLPCYCSHTHLVPYHTLPYLTLLSILVDCHPESNTGSEIHMAASSLFTKKKIPSTHFHRAQTRQGQEGNPAGIA